MRRFPRFVAVIVARGPPASRLAGRPAFPTSMFFLQRSVILRCRWFRLPRGPCSATLSRWSQLHGRAPCLCPPPLDSFEVVNNNF